MGLDKRPSSEILGKLVVTKEGKRLGLVRDLSFETRSGELIHLVLGSPTAYALALNIEKDKDNNPAVPFSSVIAVGDFIVIDQEDIK